MSLTFKQATDDINAMMKTVADNESIDVHWANRKTHRSMSEDSFVEFIIRHSGGQQDTLGGLGNRSFIRVGIAVARVFTQTGKGLSSAYALAKSIVDAYEGVHSPNGVWFRNVRIQEMGVDGNFFELQVLIEFEYNETK